MLAWLWGPLLLITYLSISRYQSEFTKLLERMSERTPAGLSVVEAPDTPAQRESRRVLRRQATQSGLKRIAAFLVVMGSLLFCIGCNGVMTGELTMTTRSSLNRNPRTATLTGEQAQTASLAMASLGVSLGLIGWLVWRAAGRGSPLRRPPPIDLAVVGLAIAMLALGIVLEMIAFL
jgi:hypothetical protein